MNHDLAWSTAETRPINVDHVGTDQHIVHGVYGLVLVNGIRPNHVTLTWTAARADLVVATLTNPATGENIDWYLRRTLLKNGGKHGTQKVDHAGNITFLELTGTTRIAWVALARNWLATYLTAVDFVLDQNGYH